MTAGQISVRDIGRFDAAVVAALQAESFRGAGWSETVVAEILAMPGAFGILLAEQERPAGFLLARAVEDECEILSLGVPPMDRGRGFGRRILRATIARARASAVRVIHLEVAEDNQAACRLYRAEGFRTTGRRPAYYERRGGAAVAALILSRRLS